MDHSQISSARSSFLHEFGYEILPGVFGGSALLLVYQDLSHHELKRSRAGARHVMSLSSVSQLARSEELLRLARGALGPAALPFRATFFDKSPESNWLVAWHQDTALPLRERIDSAGWGPWSVKYGVTYAHAPAKALEQVLALRVHLDDSSAMNGPLRVIPKTHLRGVLSDEEIQRTAGDGAAVECTAHRGGVIAMFPLVIHASSKSESELQRRVLHIEYASSLDIADGLRLAEV